MPPDIYTYIGPEALPELLAYCQQQPQQVFTLVADTNTYAALGQRVEAALREAGLNLTSIVLSGEEVVADEKTLMQVFLKAPLEPQLFIAVGSGTITDITRYASFRTGNRFVSLPTAPSVDGFISLGAPLIVGGLKDTYPTQAPSAVFADLDTLAQAPTALIAAGFGDILGKLTSLADWQLEHLIWGDPFDAQVEARVRRALQQCIDSADAIAARSLEGIRSLMEALLESGIGMLEFGNSRPASGSEHHCSHYWEMTLLAAGRPALLHGAKVGFATSLMAQHYARLRQLSRADVVDLLEGANWPSRESQLAEIEAAYGDIAPALAHIQQPYLDLSAEELETVRQRIVLRWDAIQTVLASVPPPQEIKRLLERVGGPTSGAALHLDAAQIDQALTYGHYLRRRFTVMKLLKLLGMDTRLADSPVVASENLSG